MENIILRTASTAFTIVLLLITTLKATATSQQNNNFICLITTTVITTKHKTSRIFLTKLDKITAQAVATNQKSNICK